MASAEPKRSVSLAWGKKELVGRCVNPKHLKFRKLIGFSEKVTGQPHTQNIREQRINCAPLIVLSLLLVPHCSGPALLVLVTHCLGSALLLVAQDGSALTHCSLLVTCTRTVHWPDFHGHVALVATWSVASRRESLSR